MTRVGDFIDNRYRVVDKIGEGGMSEVWLVNDQRLNKMQAVKEIKKNAKTETHHVLADRIKIEADIMRRLEHPNIVKVIDYIDDGRSLYIVMDYIQGKDLLTVMKHHLRSITEEDVVNWGIQLCDALGYLHSQGIVYRDMKPGNVMLLDDGTVKIIDFGIAREYSPDKQDDTMPLGTRGYASPEAFQKGLQTDARSDIYSLGVTLFHLVTGHGPMEFVAQPTLPPIRTINPALSDGLEYAIIKATQWDPQMRYQSCGEMLYDLDHLEDLNPERRRRLKRTMNLFMGSAIAGVVCLVLGIGCLVGSNLVRGSSYGDIMKRAATASTAETAGQPSQAEELYTQAIEISPGEIEPYLRLFDSDVRSLGVYVSDSSLSTSESSRWTKLYSAHQNDIAGSRDYAKLCYNVGLAYLLNYDYGSDLTSNAQAVSWFKLAVDNAQGSSLTSDEYNAAQAYITIGEFSQRLEASMKTGSEAGTYAEYWDALETAVNDLGSETAPIARLRLYDTAFQAINSPTYLSGFANRGGVEKEDVMRLLEKIYDATSSLEGDAMGSDEATRFYLDVVDHYQDAVSNVNSTYDNVGARAGAGRTSGTDNESGANGSSSASASSASSASASASTSSSASSSSAASARSSSSGRGAS